MQATYHLPPWLEPRTTYLHIPFCAYRCGYCDFAIAVNQDHHVEQYLDALGVELRSLETQRPVETAYIGGGTPSHLSDRQLSVLLTHFREWFALPSGAEFTLEANPDSLTHDKCQHLAEHGITRISLGVQSFQPQLLHALDRQHNPAQVAQAVAAVRAADMALSLDLIFAAPGCTLDSWLADVRAAVALKPDHISTYGLTYEKGTPLWKQQQRGEVLAVPDDLELQMYEAGTDELEAHGYHCYEVSNFARVGQQCQHNLRYWANHAYYGFGSGAASYVHGTRRLNQRNTQQYIRKVLAGEGATFQSETLSDYDRALETAAIQLRRTVGIHFAEFYTQTGYQFLDLFPTATDMLLNESLAETSATSFHLTRQGRRVADGVIEHLLKFAATP